MSDTESENEAEDVISEEQTDECSGSKEEPLLHR